MSNSRVPPTHIPADQAWFWREPWVSMEREADAEIAAGHLQTFESEEAFMAWLEAQAFAQQSAEKAAAPEETA